MSADGDRTFKPSERFTILHGDGVSRRLAERILISILYNHDIVPDIVTFACDMAAALHRALTFAEAADMAATAGAAFDSDGWLLATGPDPDRLN